MKHNKKILSEWLGKERGMKGDVESYIQYLKASNCNTARKNLKVSRVINKNEYEKEVNSEEQIS